jgi:acetoin utilization protein AcuB
MDVTSIMSKDPITVTPTMPVADARKLLDTEDIRHAPVLSEGRLVGVISDRDLYPTEAELTPVFQGSGETAVRTVQDVMHGQFTTVSPDDTVITAAVDFSVEKIGCLPVMRDEDLVGILSEMDMLLAFSRACQVGGLVDPSDHPPVADLMTPGPLAVTADTLTSDAIRTCIRIHARHLPVVDRDRLIGIVSARDLRRCDMAGKADEMTIGEIMEGEPITVGPQDPTPDAAALMATAKVSALPVVEGGKLVGLLTMTDLLDHCMATLREPDKTH